MHCGIRLLLLCAIAVFLGSCRREKPPPKLTVPEVAALLKAAVPTLPEAELESLRETTTEEVWQEFHVQVFDSGCYTRIFLRHGQLQRAVTSFCEFYLYPGFRTGTVDGQRVFHWSCSSGSGYIVSIGYLGFVEAGVLRQFRLSASGNVGLETAPDGGLLVVTGPAYAALFGSQPADFSRGRLRLVMQDGKLQPAVEWPAAGPAREVHFVELGPPDARRWED